MRKRRPCGQRWHKHKDVYATAVGDTAKAYYWILLDTQNVVEMIGLLANVTTTSKSPVDTDNVSMFLRVRARGHL